MAKNCSMFLYRPLNVDAFTKGQAIYYFHDIVRRNFVKEPVVIDFDHISVLQKLMLLLLQAQSAARSRRSAYLYL